MSECPSPPAWVKEALLSGLVVPAHPLALTPQRKLDERRQRALTRYYHAAGAGGIAVGVHTTQFEIRQHGLFKPVLALALETVATCDRASGRQTVCIAGLCGPTPQALAEARFARQAGYHAGLLSLGALRQATQEELLAHCRAIAREMPLMGFYLQPAVGGRVLPLGFWRRFVEIPNVLAIKIAPFNCYQTLDVMRALAEAGRAGEIALYTGNDDHILLDLLTRIVIPTSSGPVAAGWKTCPEPVEGACPTSLRIVGGLLGQWAVWTRRAVEMLEEVKRLWTQETVPAEMLTRAVQLTEANAAIFDAAHGYAGCIPGLHEVLRRQGLLEFTGTLDPQARLSPGQAEEIERVVRVYSFLTDDEFVRNGLPGWLD